MISIIHFLTQVRVFLEPLWQEKHRQYNDENIFIPSTYMCRFTCVFLSQVLFENGFGIWEISAGRPLESENHTIYGKYGYRSEDGKWHDHTWLVQENMIIDITSDQFGGSKVGFYSEDKKDYCSNIPQEKMKKELESLMPVVNKWLEVWHKM